MQRRHRVHKRSLNLSLELLEDRTVLSVAFTPGTLTAPAVNNTDIAVQNTFGNPIEPFVSVNPTDPGNLAVSSQNGMQVTTNAGGTGANSFTTSATFPDAAGNTSNSGDTATAYDAQGRLFWANLNDFPNQRRDVVVTQLNPTTGAQIGTTVRIPNPNGRAADKEFLAADSNPNSPYANNLYLTLEYYNSNTSEFELWFTRSTDQGKTWSTPQQLSVNSGANTEGFTWPSTVSVAPNGDVYIAYHSQPDMTDSDVEGKGNDKNPNGTSGQVVVFRSTDGGQTFSQRSLAFTAGQADITFNKQDASNGRNIPGTAFWTLGSAQPWIMADPSRPGDVYVVTSDDPNNGSTANVDHADVVFSRSTDNGKTWTTSTIQTDPANTPQQFQLFPTASIDQFGDIVVAWYTNESLTADASGQFLTSKNSSGDYLLNVWAKYSTDGGQTWSSAFQVNDANNAFDPDAGVDPTTGNLVRFNGPPVTTRIGEYFGLNNFGGTAYVAWNGNTPNAPRTSTTGQQVYFDAFPINGTLTVNGDDSGATPDDNIILRGIAGNPGFLEVLVNGQRQYAGLIAGLSGGIQVNGKTGNNTLTVDFSNGNPIPTGGITFNGGTDATKNNRLVLQGGSFSNEVYTPSGAGAGTITLDGSTINFSNLRPIDDTVAVTTDTINGTSASEPINIIDHSGPINGYQATEINSGSNPTFELVDFANKSNVIINGVGGSDTFTLNNPHPADGLTSLTINGSNAGNTFNVQAIAVPTTINAGNGINTINVYDANNSMAEITALLTLNGQLGNSTLNAANDNNFTLTDNSLTSGAVIMALSGIYNANLTGGPGDNTFDVSGWSGGGSLDGQGGNNTVIAGGKTGDYLLSDTLLTSNNGPSLRLENIQNAQLKGGAGDDEFLVPKWSGIATLDGNGGNNTYAVAMGNGGTVHIVDKAKTGTDSADIDGTDSGDTFNITPSQLTDGSDTVTYDKNLDKLSVNGGGASDVFNVTPSGTATYVLDGGAPPPPTSPGDTLNLDLTGAAGAFRTATPTATGYQGSWTFANRQPVNFSHMETLTPALHLTGAGTPINGFEYSALNGTLAANFTNANFLVPATDFVASINWGDGAVTAGTITLSGNTYLITGSHTYTDESTYSVKITVSGDLTSAHFTTTATMLEELLPDGTRGTANQRFISELYRDLLGHPVDQGSLDFWNNLLNLGLPQTFVVLGIESTPEYQQLQVQSLYQRYLQRPADSFELSLGTDFLLAGGTPEQLAMYLVSTPEFFFQQGGGSLNGFLSALYQDALQSPIVAQAEMTDLAALAQGTSLSDVVQNVFQLPGYQQGVVNDLILQLLDRNPTGTDTADLSLALETGFSDNMVLALLATSTPYQEYFDKTA